MTRKLLRYAMLAAMVPLGFIYATAVAITAVFIEFSRLESGRGAIFMGNAMARMLKAFSMWLDRFTKPENDSEQT